MRDADSHAAPHHDGACRLWFMARGAMATGGIIGMERHALLLAFIFCALLNSGCTCCATYFSRHHVDTALQERTGYSIPEPECYRSLMIPPGVSWDDTLTEDEAVAIALWNNAAFQEALTELDLVRADVIQSSELPNPELWFLAPVGVKQVEYAVEFQLEALWLRPKRIAVASSESARVAENLVQTSLTLIRDVRVTYIDVQLAEDRFKIATDLAKVRKRIADLAKERLNAGDASPVEVSAAVIDAERAEQETARLEYDVKLAMERLQHVLGVIELHPALNLAEAPLLEPEQLPQEVDDLVADALASRSDLVATNRAVDSADAALQLANHDWFRFGFINDANGRGLKGYEDGPGVRVTIPLFNRNCGRISRALAQVERTIAQQTTLRDRIILEVRQADLQLKQARADLDRWRTTIHPAVDDAIRKMERAYQEGDTGLALVLETTRQLFEAQAREAQLRADVRRAVAELERGVGHQLVPPPDAAKEPESDR